MRFESRLNRMVLRKFSHWTKSRRDLLARIVLYLVLLVASVFLSFVFISYFVEPWDLLGGWRVSISSPRAASPAP